MKQTMTLSLVVFFLSLPAAALAQVIPLDCMADIVTGTTVDLEQSGSNANAILVAFDMAASPDSPITALVPWVVGDSCAPIQTHSGFGTVRIETTNLPWQEIGLTAVGTLLATNITLTLASFDENNTPLGSITKEFQPGGTQESYNNAALFLGFSSAAPIYAIELESDNPNVAWDHLRYFNGGQFIRGDTNADGSANIADAIFLLGALFLNDASDTPCYDSADANDDGIRDIADVVFLLASLFSAGEEPPPPFADCGLDPTTADPLGCIEFAPCP